ncbi:diadenosine tetraphosphate hydrolase [candidate division WWE3 bacterium CG08_land_8_20_14_0_20_40_13]|uniref:Diadenosine tetraphosphate hydrolase n=1 Tax=candidate division WWE3 bacterium CG08_land_8_20_14_0_20_40_13 TaxID=1975084 RepID=A0A2H0XES4_UNCKA|nr:MAG: diadenosine tetraphosphate hydrolase [candidate division WWE3 bacterium CG08_land_8_20_14_0_20_40_13]
MDQKREIEDIKGNKKQLGCLGCAIQNGEVESPGGSIASTKYFDAHQDYEIPIPGFVILASKRHLQSIDEFIEEERLDFIEFLCRLRKTMRQAFDVQVIYLIQEEDTSHHFHVWIFPRYDWMVEKFGKKIQSVRPIMEYARENMKTSENLKKVDEAMEKMKTYF